MVIRSFDLDQSFSENNSLPLIWQSVFSDCNCLTRGNELQCERTICLIGRIELKCERTDCQIWGNDIQSDSTECLNRGNEKCKSRKGIAIRENELSNLRERIDNPWQRILNPRKRITIRYTELPSLFFCCWKSLCSFRAFVHGDCFFKKT